MVISFNPIWIFSKMFELANCVYIETKYQKTEATFSTMTPCTWRLKTMWQNNAKQGEHRMCLMYSTAQTNDCMGLIVTSVFVGNLQTSTESTVPYQHHLCDLGSAWCSRPLLAYLLADINQHRSAQCRSRACEENAATAPRLVTSGSGMAPCRVAWLSKGSHGNPCVRVTEPGPQRLAALWSETQMVTPPAQKVSNIRGGTGGFGIHI